VNGRKEPIRGLWECNGRYYAQLAFEDGTPGRRKPAAAADFHLQAGSPARGVGEASGVPDGGTAWDFDGKPRPTSGGQGTGYDLGAYQY
jgi:hypothetical protein